MKIKQVDTFPLFYRLPRPYGDANGYKYYRSCYLFRITTESGWQGWGECVDWLPTLDKGFKERIIPYLLGQDAANRLQLVSTISKWHERAAAGVSMALTEIIAKKSYLSICELWGGKYRDRIPVYASFQSYTEGNDWIKHSLAKVEESVYSGFGKLKVKIGGKSIEQDQAHLEQLQSLIGEKIQLAVDANQSYDLSTARQWIRFLSTWSNLLWFEEPMPLDRPQEYVTLRSQSAVPLAGGENLLSSKNFLSLLQVGSLDIIQPDVLHVQGIDDFRHALHLGRTFGIRVSAHCYDGAISRLYALYAQACLPAWSKMNMDDIEPVEWDVMDNPFTQLLPLKPQDGQIEIPTGVGIGLTVDEELMKKYLWDGSFYV